MHARHAVCRSPNVRFGAFSRRVVITTSRMTVSDKQMARSRSCAIVAVLLVPSARTVFAQTSPLAVQGTGLRQPVQLDRPTAIMVRLGSDDTVSFRLSQRVVTDIDLHARGEE